MAGTIQGQLRHYLDLVESESPWNGELFESKTPWGVSRSPIFDESLRANTRVFKDLPDRVAKFIEFKCNDPINSKYGKHDRPLTGELVGFWHCHLRDDAVLIYNLLNRCVNLVYIAPHAEIEGKRLKMTGARLAPYNTTRQASKTRK